MYNDFKVSKPISIKKNLYVIFEMGLKGAIVHYNLMTMNFKRKECWIFNAK
jgi:hypothetical protein